MTSTRERILATSLELFNRQGERNVTTNHIAEALGISPGNLYYHFRNKGEIVKELFIRYQAMVEAFLQVPADRPLTWQDKVGYLESILESIWATRFLHRDLGHLLTQDETLREDYREFVSICLKKGLNIYQGLRASGLIAASDEDLQALMVNTWVIVASWAMFVQSMVPDDHRDLDRDRKLLQQGIYQVVCLEAPYLKGEALEHLDSIKARYGSAANAMEMLAGQAGMRRDGNDDR
jgi:AcrR family transcriptional regulator